MNHGTSDRTTVIGKIAELLEIEPASIDVNAPLFSLTSSSFRVVELVIELQEEFGVSFGQEDMNGVETIGDLVGLVVSRRQDCRERASG
jgi:acyl carrier protein